MSKWISVEERYPSFDQDLIIASYSWSENCIITEVAYWNNLHGKFTCIGSGYDLPNVTHWMPLPEPPKENNNEN